MACALGELAPGHASSLYSTKTLASLPPTSRPGPLLPLATSEEHTLACYEEGPAAAGLASPAR